MVSMFGRVLRSVYVLVFLVAVAGLSACGGNKPTPTYTIGGTVSGLAGTGLVLQNNGGDDLAVSANGSFSFSTTIADGSTYSVSVLTKPSSPSQICSVTSGSGTVSGANVTGVAITCVNDYTIGGTVSGLAGTGLVLQNNGGDDLAVSANGSFSFSTTIADGSTYSVSVLSQPTSQLCSVTSGSGTVSGANVTGVGLSCQTLVTSINSLPGLAAVSWTDLGATSYDLYRSTDRNCDFSSAATVAGCAGGTVTTGVVSPMTVTGLTNGTAYYFVLKGNFAGGTTVASNLAAAQPDQLMASGAVNAIAHDASGNTYLGGNFTQVSARTGNGVPLSTVNSALASGFPVVSGIINAAAADGSGGWYIGGSFTAIGGVTRTRLAHINADGTLDATWAPSANNLVRALVVSGTTVYVGGYFTSIDDGKGGGAQTRNRLAAIGTDGTLNTTWVPSANNFVNVLAVSGSTVYAGGDYTTIDDGKGGGAQTRNHLAAIGTDGTLGTTWNPSANGTIYTLAVSGTTVYAGGTFTTIDDGSGGGAQTRNNLAAIGTDGALSTTWAPNANSNVNALAVSGTTVYAGGTFTTIDDGKGGGAQARNYLAAIGTDGALSTTWVPSANNWVFALAASGTTVYAGGAFSTLDDGKGGGTQTRNRLAAIGTDGVLNTTWAPGTNSNVNALAVSGSTVYAGGEFTTIGGVTRKYLAAIDTNGALLGWNPSANNWVYALTVSGTTVYAGGNFSSIDDGKGGGAQNRNRLAAIGTDGTLGTTWNPSANGTIYTLAVSGTTVYAGGSFTTIDDRSGGGAQTRNRLAAIGTSGALSTTWVPSANNLVRALVVSGTTVYAGGYFTTIDDGSGGGAQTRNRLAAIGTSGALSTTWVPSVDNSVYALTVSGTTVYAGGAFFTLDDGKGGGAQARTRLAAIGTDGALSTTWVPSANSFVTALTVSGTTVYAGGYFTSIDDGKGGGAQTRNRLAAIGTDGALSTTWAPNANSNVNALAVSGTTVYAGGNFTSIDGEPANYFAAIPQ